MREMKDSGIEWIGKIPSDWNIIRFWQAIEKMGTGLNPRENFVLSKDDEFYYVTIRNFKDGKLYLDDNCDRINRDAWNIIQARSDLKKGDILFASISKDGQAYVIDKTPDNWNINESVFCIRVDAEKYLSRFFYYLLINDAFYSDLRLDATGTTFQSVKQNKLKKSILPLLSKEEQLSIVDYLDSKCSKIDEIIAKQEKIIEKLKEYKLSVITEAVTRGLDPNVEMKDSGHPWIGKIPKHWEMVYAKQLFRQRKERAYDNDEQLTASQQHGIISQKYFMEIEGRQVMQVMKGEDILKHVEKGDFVISMRSFQGGLEYSEVTGKISSAYVMLIPNHGDVYDRYYKWLFKSMRYIVALQGTSNLIRDGQALRFSNFIQVYLPKLGKREQKEIADYLDRICPRIENEISKREKMIDRIKGYKKSLIYEVVTGKLEV